MEIGINIRNYVLNVRLLFAVASWWSVEENVVFIYSRFSHMLIMRLPLHFLHTQSTQTGIYFMGGMEEVGNIQPAEWS